MIESTGMDESSTEGSNETGQTESQETTNEQGSEEITAKDLKKYLDEQSFDSLVKVKVGGEEIEVPLKEALKDYQLRQASYKKMEEAAHEKQRAKQFLELAEKDPFEFLKTLGKDPRALTEDYLAKQLEYELMSEEQRQWMKDKQELEEYKSRQKQYEEQLEQQRIQAEEQKISQQIDTELTQAFSESKLPKHKFFVQQVAATLLDAAKQGVDLKPKDAVVRVERAFTSYLPEILQSLPPEKLVEILGSGARKKLREFELSQIGAKQAQTKSPAKSASDNDEPWQFKNRKKPMTEKEYRSWVENLQSKDGG